MTKFIRFLSIFAVLALISFSVKAQSLSYTADLPNPGWIRTMEVAVPSTNFTITLNPTNLTAKEAWLLLSVNTKINLPVNTATTNAWTISLTPCNFETTPVGAGLSTYNIVTLAQLSAGTEVTQPITNCPPIRSGDVLTLKGNGATTTATNTTVLLQFYRVMPYRNNYGLPQI